jgi:hypothetical protein
MVPPFWITKKYPEIFDFKVDILFHGDFAIAKINREPISDAAQDKQPSVSLSIFCVEICTTESASTVNEFLNNLQA